MAQVGVDPLALAAESHWTIPHYCYCYQNHVSDCKERKLLLTLLIIYNQAVKFLPLLFADVEHWCVKGLHKVWNLAWFLSQINC